MNKMKMAAVAVALAAVGSAQAEQTFQLRVSVEGLKEKAAEPAPGAPFQQTFTTCGKSGRVGPSLSQCLNAYTDQDVTKDGVNYAVINGIQSFQVPSDGTYRIKALGAAGDNNNGYFGKGAIMQAEFELNAGDQLWVLVGQKSVYNGVRDWQGGSGGTFVAIGDHYSSSTPLIVAGGGGTSRSTETLDPRMNGSTSTSGNDGEGSAGGANGGAAAGGGHNQDSAGGGAAGFYGNGSSKGDLRDVPAGYYGTYDGAAAFINGGYGGEFETGYDLGNPLHGAFGGGGPGGWGGAGGGGGYSGGGNCNNTGYSGGGGSFIAASAKNAATSDGRFGVTGQEPTSAYTGAIQNLGAFNSGAGKVIVERL